MFMTRNIQALVPGFTDRRAERERRATIRHQQATLAALEEHQAIIEISSDGSVIGASPRFAALLGLPMEALSGKPYRNLLAAADRDSAAARDFAAAVSHGEAATAHLRHAGKDGEVVLLQLQATPVPADGDVLARAIVLATDVTGASRVGDDQRGQLTAIGKSQAVIEFGVDGRVLTANANFLSALGYTLEDIKGQHHSMFVDPVHRQSPDYRLFWDKLARGEYDDGQYKRIGKGGREVWIQASYNPIMDLNGKPFKVVKYATDVTQMVITRVENEKGISESVSVLQDLAAGNLTKKMEYNYKGTFAEIKTALNSTIEKLKETVLSMKNSANSVNSASSEIASGSKDLSERTEQQASSLEETAAG